jgi:ElaB/YqjD/DUF883 family membrane-anchored ribosome-binding protein
MLKIIRKKRQRLILKQNKDISIEDLKHRKERLKKEIENLESDMDKSFTKVKENTFGSFKPVSAIKNNPFKAVGIAVITGIAFGLTGKKKTKKSSQRSDKYGFGGLLLDELKRLAARRATEYVSAFIDSQITPRVHQKFDKNEKSKTKTDS